MPIHKVVKILSNEHLASAYYRVRLSCPEIAAMANPGQFITLRVDERLDPFLRRPFSIHSIIRKGNRIEGISLLYYVRGKTTGLLAKLKKGDPLDIFGPLGRGFPLRDDQVVHYGLVAGGVGIAPLYFFVQRHNEQVKEQGLKGREVTLLYGAKARKDLVCLRELRQLGVKVKVITEDGSVGKKGRVTDYLEDFIVENRLSIGTTLFACGPRPMLERIAEIVRTYNIPCYLSLDYLITCGIGACLGCVVKMRVSGYKQRTKESYIYKRICKEGPVFNAEEIIWK